MELTDRPPRRTNYCVVHMCGTVLFVFPCARQEGAREWGGIGKAHTICHLACVQFLADKAAVNQSMKNSCEFRKNRYNEKVAFEWGAGRGGEGGCVFCLESTFD